MTVAPKDENTIEAFAQAISRVFGIAALSRACVCPKDMEVICPTAAEYLREQLEEVLDTLAPREKKVLELRFGIVDGRTRTLEEVGKEFNVTRERIRQIEAKALRKLRHPSRSKKLRDFLN